jgi:hypothetical protein
MAQGFLFRTGRELSAQTLTGQIEATNWTTSNISGVDQNDVVFGGLIQTQTSVNYSINFQDEVTGNDFANLPSQQLTWSSDSTTGPITITKETGLGQFTGKFVGAILQVFQTTGPTVIYTITEVIDQNTLTAFYQPGPSQNATLDNIINLFGGPGSNLRFLFAQLNGTPEPNTPYLRHGGFNDQESRVYSSPGFFKGASIDRYFNIPTNATSIAVLNELPNVPNIIDNRGIRAYAVIFDNKDAFISTSQGVRRIAKIENGNTFINFAQNHTDEDWQQSGGSLQFITPFAMEIVAANRATNTDWANAVPIDISTYTQVTLAFALDTFADDEDAATLGAQLVYNLEVPEPGGFDANDFIAVELNIDENTIGDASDITDDWAKINFYEVIDDNTIRFFAADQPIIDIPARVRVIK